MTDKVQELRTEMNEVVNGRVDMLSSINTALQKVSAKNHFQAIVESATSFQETGKAAMTKDNFDTSCRTCTCGCKRGQTKEKQFLSALRSSDKFDNSTLAVDCSDEKFRTIEASLCKVLQRTTASEPLRVVPQTRGQKGSEAWHAIVKEIRSEKHV